MLDVNAIYFKTEAGLLEVQSRTLGLRAELRRLLIVVDGSSSVSRLATFVRGTEIAPLISELETHGLIMSPATSAYRKTEAGIVEVQTRALELRPELRHLLILVDGRTALSQLARFLPSLPVLDLMAELETAGLIVEPSAAGTSVSAVVAPVAAPNQAIVPATSDTPVTPENVSARTPDTDERLLIVRAGAARGLRRILGVESHEWLDKLQQPEDSLTLRAAITEIHQILEEQFGVTTGQQFLDSVRSAAESGRNLPS